MKLKGTSMGRKMEELLKDPDYLASYENAKKNLRADHLHDEFHHARIGKLQATKENYKLYEDRMIWENQESNIPSDAIELYYSILPQYEDAVKSAAENHQAAGVDDS